jgi:hypothetical protein
LDGHTVKTGEDTITLKLTVINFLAFRSMINCGWNKECEVFKQYKCRKQRIKQINNKT